MQAAWQYQAVLPSLPESSQAGFDRGKMLETESSRAGLRGNVLYAG